MVPSHALTTLLFVNALPNILQANISYNIERNHRFCSFASFLNVSLILFINNYDFSIDLIIFITSSLFSFEYINSVVPDP